MSPEKIAMMLTNDIINMYIEIKPQPSFKGRNKQQVPCSLWNAMAGIVCDKNAKRTIND